MVVPASFLISPVFRVIYNGWRGSLVPLIIVTRLALNPQSPQLNISHISFSRLLSIRISLLTVAKVFWAASVAIALRFIPALLASVSRLDRRNAMRSFIVLAIFTHRSLSPLHQQSKDFNLAISSAPMALMSVMAVLRSSSMALYRSFWLSNSKYTSFSPDRMEL